MRLFVLYDRDGTVRSAMKVEVMGDGLDHPYGWLEEGAGRARGRGDAGA